MAGRKQAMVMMRASADSSATAGCSLVTKLQLSHPAQKLQLPKTDDNHRSQPARKCTDRSW